LRIADFGLRIVEEKIMKQRIVVRAEIFREGDLFVGMCPDSLDTTMPEWPRVFG
jgi:hypothetical protein